MVLYRDAIRVCPRCATTLAEAGAGLRCRGCLGVWLGEPAFAEMLFEMHDGPTEADLDERAGDRELPCPDCRRSMRPLTLEGVPVDRCDEGHGYWFDRDELQQALLAAGRRPPIRRGDPR